jgi:Na+/melibiose symporter-like transporter
MPQQHRSGSSSLSISRANILKRAGYGMGHVFNDMCGAMGFTYSLIFFQKVLGFSSFDAGIFMAIGQLADGLSTVLVGILSDNKNLFWLCTRYGNRKAWHLVGTIIVVLTFPFIFMKCLNCEDSSQQIKMVYYSAFVVVLQFGWASVQISHLALIPELTSNENEQTLLTSIR